MKEGSFEDLASLYFDDALDADGVAALNVLLASRPDLARRFVTLGRVHAGIQELSGRMAQPSRRRFPRRILLGAVLTAAAAAGLLLAVSLFRPAAARLEDSAGGATFDGTVLESPSAGTATVLLPDGTRLHAGPDTSVRVEPGRITLTRGTLGADVAKQAAGKELVFATPQASARVLGTRLFLAVEPDSTLCRVEEGRVRLTRQDGGQSVDVPGGSYAVAAPQSELKVEPVARVARKEGVPGLKILAPARWPKSYTAYPFHADSLLYRDRGWRITDIPAEVDGALGIATLAEDRRSQEETLLVFEVDREVDVWVGIDGRAVQLSKKLPTWLKGWEATGLRVYSKTASNSYYHLFRRRYPAGKVTLGGNHCGGDTGAAVNYTVLVTIPDR